MQEDVLEVLCERPQDGHGARSRSSPGVKEAALFGKGLHVVADDADGRGRAIRELLARARASGRARSSRSSRRWKTCSSR